MGSLDGLGLALARLAEEKRVARTELASRLKIGKPTVTKMLATGSMPNAKTLGRVLDALGCSLHDLARALDAVNGRALEIAEPRQAYQPIEAGPTLLAMSRIMEKQSARIEELEKRLDAKD